MSKLGERIDVSSISDDDLPYPGQDKPVDEDPFSSAEEVTAPFGAVYTADTVVPPKAPVKQATLPPKKKPSLQLQKFREAFGIKRITKVPHTVTYKGEGDENLSMTFHLRAMGYEDFQWALEQARNLTDLPLVVAWNLTSIAVSVCAMDFNFDPIALPTPTYLVFDVPTDNQVRDPYYPPATVRFEAAAALMEELRGSFFNLVEELREALDTKIGGQYKTLSEEKVESPLV
jgi:hypothetical protein